MNPGTAGVSQKGGKNEENWQKAMMGSDFPPPTGQGSGQPPSREEMEKMMQQMQELMKKTQKQ